MPCNHKHKSPASRWDLFSTTLSRTWINKWFNFFSPTIDHFSPSKTCFLQIPAHWIYLSFGATLAPIGICDSTVGTLVAQQLLMKVSCILVHARSIASHKTGAYTLSFFEIKGRTDRATLSESPSASSGGWNGLRNGLRTIDVIMEASHLHNM